MKLAFTLATILVMTLSAYGATTWYIPDDFPAIQDALSDVNVMNGDTIIVRPGTYVENIDFLGKAVTLKSEQGPGLTVIDGNKSGSVVSFLNGEGRDSVLQGFTITNGTGTVYELSPGDFETYGGGIFCHSSSPTISSNIIDLNIITDSDGRGGGIGCFEYASPVIEDNTISDNGAPRYGGGIYCDYFCTPVISGNLITSNSAGNGGGGYYGVYSTPEIRENTFSMNTAEDGGAIYGLWDSAGTKIIGNTIIGNKVLMDGAGIRLSSASTPVITGNTINGNEAGNAGGGMYLYGTDPLIEDNIITENKAEFSGGGIRCRYYCDPVIRSNFIADNSLGSSSFSSGGGIHCSGFCNAVIENNEITGNHGDNGAGVYCSDHATAVIDGNLFIKNTAFEEGGAIYLGDCFAKVRNNIIAGNSGKNGGGMSCIGESQVIVSNTFYGNSAGFYGGGCNFYGVNSTLSNNILWDNFALTAGKEIYKQYTTLTISHCDIDDAALASLPGCFQEDPLFVDPLADDFHLTFGSPCRNTGTNSGPNLPFTDFEGDIRIFQGTVDVGADEFYRHLYITGDKTPGGLIEGKLIGMPGTTPVGLFIGTEVLPTPLTTPWGEFHIDFPYILLGPLGAIPQDGVMVIPARLPSSPSAPYEVPLQALIGLNPNSLTNLFVLEVR